MGIEASGGEIEVDCAEHRSEKAAIARPGTSLPARRSCGDAALRESRKVA